MSTPTTTQRGQESFPAFEADRSSFRYASDEDGTLRGEEADGHTYLLQCAGDTIDRNQQARNHDRLRVITSHVDGSDHAGGSSSFSPAQQREQSQRLDDELEMLRAETVVSSVENSKENMGKIRSNRYRSRSRTGGDPVDDFDIGTTPIHEKAKKLYHRPADPSTSFAKFFKRLHQSSFLVRWIFYITPLTLLLLIPTVLGLLVFMDTTVGGVRLFWFGIWLEIVWLTLWLSRVIAIMIPWPVGLISSLFTNNCKKWRDLGKALEIPATLFFWILAIQISFLPIMKNHHLNHETATRHWESLLNKIITSMLVGVSLNLAEKFIIQIIAISFHLRTYADRIEVIKFQISSLVKLYMFSKEKIAMCDHEFELKQRDGRLSGIRTPMAYVEKAGKNARYAFTKVKDVAGKVAGDFTGQAVKTSSHPSQVVLQLLNSTNGSQVLARRLYRTFARDGSETVLPDDLRPAFDNDEEASAAFTMFDKDLNGDISMEELEAVCVEIGRERKGITASLKDLDSVISKLDKVLLFIVTVITVLVLVSLLSHSASGVLTSAGSTILALSWLLQATAQEFLQSIIFVFVKHPFDVGDRVTIYGNTGELLKGDDYFVKEISLLYTEFKKMQGHVVQAPNSYLNTIFILNQRRSGGLAESVPVTVKFGTTLEQIDTLRQRLLEFVTSENREYQSKILTELTTIYEAHSITVNVVFFYKSNWQNELLRLQRRNKFICAMMVTMNELGIEGPRMRLAGAAEEFPIFLHGAYPEANHDTLGPVPGPRSGSLAREPPIVPGAESPHTLHSHPSILRNQVESGGRRRDESISTMGKRVDFSLGMSAISSGAEFGDVYEDREPIHLPQIITATSPVGDRGGEDAWSVARTTSRESQNNRSVSSSSKNRNRFFSRGRNRLAGSEDDTSLDDLEAGQASRNLTDMPDIPEDARSRRNSVG